VDGTQALTANWDAGPYSITALAFNSDVTTGTPPLIVASTTAVSNLNVDQVDGKDATDLVLVDGTQALTANWDAGSYSITALAFNSDVATGTPPLIVASTTAVSNLNVDQVDGKDATDLVLVDGTQALTADWDIGNYTLTTGGLIADYSFSPGSGDACTAGAITWDANFGYICTASGAWKRFTLVGGY